MTGRNPHMQQADGNMAYSDSVDNVDGMGILWMQRAQVEATLAVAYEQRTATLVALFVAPEATMAGTDYQGIADQIKERLGL